MDSSATVDRSQLPLVVMTFVGAPSLDQLDESLREFDVILRTHQRYVLVIDLSRMGIIASAIRHRAASWLIANGPDVVELGAGVICVATSPLARAAIRAMEWLDPRGAKYVIVDTLEDGLRCARDQIREIEPP